MNVERGKGEGVMKRKGGRKGGRRGQLAVVRGRGSRADASHTGCKHDSPFETLTLNNGRWGGL